MAGDGVRVSYSSGASSSGVVGQAAPTGAVQLGGVAPGGKLLGAAFDAYGNQKVVAPPFLNGIYLGQQWGFASRLVGGQRVAAAFNPVEWSKITSGSGTVEWDSTSGEYRLRVTGANGDRAMVLSNRGALYRFLRGVNLRIAFRLASGVAVGVRYEQAGYGDVGANASTGLAIGFYAEGDDFGIFLRDPSLGTTNIPQSEWNVDKLDGAGPSEWTVTPADLVRSSELNVFLDWITIFRVGSTVVHVLDLGNPGTSPLPWMLPALQRPLTPVSNPFVLRVGVNVTRVSAGAGNADAYTHAAMIESIVGEGSDDRGAPYFASKTGTATIASGVTRPFISLRPAATIGGKVNPFRAFLQLASFVLSRDGEAQVWYGTSSQIALTGANWVAVGSGSGMEVDTSATAVTLSSAHPVAARALSADTVADIDLTDKFTLGGGLPFGVYGDGTQPILCCAIKNDAGANGSGAVRGLAWDERV